MMLDEMCLFYLIDVHCKLLLLYGWIGKQLLC